MRPHRTHPIAAALLAAAALATPALRAGAPANPAAAASPAPPVGERRVALPAGPDGKPFPYTVEVPAGWEVLQSQGIAGFFLGPAGLAKPESDPRVVYVRLSSVSLADPAAVVTNIKSSAKGNGGDAWSAPIDEVRTVGGVHGVLVRMDHGSGATARSTLVLKMPRGDASVDFIAMAPRDEFERQLPTYQRILFSLLPAH